MEYVYVLSNRGLKKNLLKIGYTKLNPYVRAYQLSKPTGVPFPYDIEYVIDVYDGKKLETKIHEYMQNYRSNEDREFFQIDKLKLKHILTCELHLSFNYKLSNDDNFKDEINELKDENIKLKNENIKLQNKTKELENEKEQNKLLYVEQIATLKDDLRKYINMCKNEEEEKCMLKNLLEDKDEQVATLKDDLNKYINKYEEMVSKHDNVVIEHHVLKLQILIFFYNALHYITNN